MKEDCAVVFLAGGQSSRMGSPKAWLEFEGRPLLQHLVERMLRHFPEAVVVGAPGQELPETPATVVRDDVPGEGPVRGMAAGLRAVTRPLAFITSCDAPFLDPGVARYLANVCACYDVAVPEWEGRLNPLHAVYRSTVQPLLERNLAEGRRRPVHLFEQVRTCTVPEAELQALDPEGRTFMNVNSPEDYARAARLWPQWARQGRGKERG